MDGGACLYFVCVFCSSPEGYSLERLVVAHGLECGGRDTTGGSCGSKRGQAQWRCHSNDPNCEFRVNAKYDAAEDLHFITGLRGHSCLTRDIKKRRMHRLREYGGKSQDIVHAAIAPSMAGGGGGGAARSLQGKLVEATGEKFHVDCIRRELARTSGGSPLEKAMGAFGYLRSDLQKLAESRPSLAIALESGTLGSQFWDMDATGGWPQSEIDTERRHTFRLVHFCPIFYVFVQYLHFSFLWCVPIYFTPTKHAFSSNSFSVSDR